MIFLWKEIGIFKEKVVLSTGQVKTQDDHGANIKEYSKNKRVRDYQRDRGTNLQDLPMAKAQTKKKKKKNYNIVIYYKPKYKRNVHSFPLT